METQTLTIAKEMTGYTAAKEMPKLLNFLKKGKHLEINLANVTHIDAAGLQLLILIKKEAVQAEKNLSFVMHSKAVLELLELAKLGGVFCDQMLLAFGEEHA